VVKDTDEIEVLMVRRPLTSRFMPGVWVFPGGAVDSEDAGDPTGFNDTTDEWRVAAMRELIEETGIWITTDGTIERSVTDDPFGDVAGSGVTIDVDALTYFANWITPEVFPIRFDTRFFLARVDATTVGSVDGEELIDHEWISPHEALRRESVGEWDIAFPTRETLKMLGSEGSGERLVARLRQIKEVPAVEPRLLVTESEARILLPDDEEFEAAGPSQKDPTILTRLQAIVAQGGLVPAEFRGRS
jgi:8-oxo-dGTP pyrophosphatase MutT (NUDIX family)